MKKAIELLRHAIINDDSDADIKMYVFLKKGWQMKYVVDEEVRCPDCSNNFEDIRQLRKHDKKYTFTCYGCGECFKGNFKRKAITIGVVLSMYFSGSHLRIDDRFRPQYQW